MNFQEYFNLKSEGLFKSDTATFRGEGMSIYLFFSSSTQQELFLILIRTKFNQIKILCFQVLLYSYRIVSITNILLRHS